MAKLPVVAIIGRPNTGKSTLFNRIVGRRHAIVSDVPGTTRDPVAIQVGGEKVDYLLMDTGGMGGGTDDRDFENDVEAQSIVALEHADLIVFVVDSREELTSGDFEVVDCLRKKRRKHVPIILVPAKCDNPNSVDEIVPKFYELDVADAVIPVSAVHGIGMDELEESVEDRLFALHFGGPGSAGPESRVSRVALVGRPNVGKSSILNALMSDPQRKIQGRMVSGIPGTTRDTTDTFVRYGGKEYLFLDTAGLKKKRSFGVEAFAAIRTLRAIESADVTILVLDPSIGIGRQDKRIASLAIERGTGLMLVANKVDLLDAVGREAFRDIIYDAFSFCRWAPVLFTSAETRENLPKTFECVDSVCKNRTRRIETPQINKWFRDVVAAHQSAGMGSGASRTKYITQIATAPPTFALFLNDPKRLHFSSIRFMENKLREEFMFGGTPVKWVKRTS